MAILKVHKGKITQNIKFEGRMKLSDLLLQNGLSTIHPCGGRGVCGKCRVEITGSVSAPNALEQKAGCRLSCQAEITGDCEVILPEDRQDMMIETGSGQAETVQSSGISSGKIGAAVDIGTTTMALKLYDLQSFAELASAAMLNPQGSVAADVMGRIGASMGGKRDLLRQQVTGAIEALLQEACEKAEIAANTVTKMVVTGNTTMLYLLTGRDPEALSHAPFEADCLFDETIDLFGIPSYLPPCAHAFVGADITCAILVSHLCRGNETAALCDIGTNGEMALWKDGRLYVASTAAGPAFEGAGITMGSGSVTGAINGVSIVNGKPHVSVIGNTEAQSLCGSGLLDAIAVGLALEEIDETGAMEEDEFPLGGAVSLFPKDVRAVQLAKAAIAAGLETLLDSAGIKPKDVSSFDLAGGFGSNLNLRSAAAIGLLPEELVACTTVLGNAALSGAAQLLLHKEATARAREIAKNAVHVPLGGNPKFNERYMDNMLFPEQE